MAFIETMPVSQASDPVRAMYRQQQDYWGYVPNYAKLFSHRPEALVRWGKLLAELRRPVSDRRYELVTLTAALAHRSTPCALAHAHELAKACDEETVRALVEGREAEVLSPADLAMVRFARTVAKDATEVTTTQIDELRGLGFTDADIFDLTAIAALRSFLTKLMDGLGCLADEALEARMTTLAPDLVVGRPVDTSPVEQLPGTRPDR